MLELARRHPDDPASFDALAWLAILGYNAAASDEAAEVLARRYGPDKRLWLISQEMRRGIISPARGILLRAVLEHNADRATRGRACLDLAEYHAELASFVQILKTPACCPGRARRTPRSGWIDSGPSNRRGWSRTRQNAISVVLDEFAEVVPIRWWTVPRMLDSDPRTIYARTRTASPIPARLPIGAARAG